MILIIGGAFQGKRRYAEQNYSDCTIIPDFHKKIYQWLQEGKNAKQETEKLLCQMRETEWVIILDEIGYGIVPTDAFLRQYREETGRIGCLLASSAQKVIRVTAGIGTIIKENK